MCVFTISRFCAWCPDSAICAAAVRIPQDELRDDIRDEEYLFDSSRLSKRERADLEYKKKIYSLAEQHRKAREIEKVDRYVC